MLDFNMEEKDDNMEELLAPIRKMQEKELKKIFATLLDHCDYIRAVLPVLEIERRRAPEDVVRTIDNFHSLIECLPKIAEEYKDLGKSELMLEIIESYKTAAKYVAGTENVQTNKGN